MRNFYGNEEARQNVARDSVAVATEKAISRQLIHLIFQLDFHFFLIKCYLSTATTFLSFSPRETAFFIAFTPVHHEAT